MNIKTATTDNLKIIAYDLSESISLQQNNLNVIMSEIRLRQQQPPTPEPEPEPEPEQPQSETVSDAKTETVDVNQTTKGLGHINSVFID